ncbi:glycosyltransferase family 2 protein [Gelidibacter sp. F2691]|nr:glycosyltransferase family 2 protein [Gelidibacter sp. F2691]
MISIVVPYYNRPTKLRRCIISIIKQTYSDLEVIIIDDFSTIPIINDFKDSRIRIFRNEKNMGPGVSRNIGLKKAKGDYIAFLDSDDYWDLRFLEKCMLHFRQNKDVAMVYANGYRINDVEKVVGIRRNSIETPNTILPEILQKTRHWGTGGCLWKMDWLKNVKWQSSIPWEDYAFDIDVAINCNKISGIKECLVYYDITGTDKISRQNRELAIIGKNKSLIYISSSLLKSKYSKDLIIKNAITNQLINNIILLINFNIQDKSFKFSVIDELVKWNRMTFRLYIHTIVALPEKTQLRLLRRLKT